MKRILYALLISAATGTLSSCDDLGIDSDVPSCIRTQTEEFARTAPCKTDARTTGASVKEYRFQNQNVYVFDVGGCVSDGSASVLDSNCRTLGFLGGFLGNTTINGESFSKAEYKRTVWEN